MEVALSYYRCSGHTPNTRYLDASKYPGRLYYVGLALLKLGMVKGNLDELEIRVYNKERLFVAACVIGMKWVMGEEFFNEAI